MINLLIIVISIITIYVNIKTITNIKRMKTAVNEIEKQRIRRKKLQQELEAKKEQQ